MLSTKTHISDVGEILAKKGSEFTFQDPELISAPSTQITTLDGLPRQIKNPAKTLRLAMGVERVMINSILVVPKEKGPNGEQIFQIDARDDRFRFAASAQNSYTQQSRVVLTEINDFIEITFQGTGLNALSGSDGARDVRVTVDGGAESATPWPAAQASSIGARQYKPNIIIPIVSGLAYGTHTVKLRMASSSDTEFYGFEILNNSTQLRMPQGEIFSQGRKYVNSAVELFDYNTGFDGSPVLNGRGGRVLVYKTPEGLTKKAIQQVDSSALYLDNANHANEEEIGRTNFRKFGANRADDFSTLGNSTSNRAFTLDDGTTALLGHQVLVDPGEDGVRMAGVSGNFIVVTFVGTGLDALTYEDAGGGQQTSDLIIDGVTVSTTYATPLAGRRFIKKIVSGLPYGTHTVKWQTTTAATGNYHFVEFIVYGPKKPALPEGCVEVANYNLMANYVPNATAGLSTIATGVLRKSPSRELLYVNGTGGSADWNVGLNTSLAMDWQASTNRQNAFSEYFFFGTGFELRGYADPSYSSSITVSANGSTLNTTNFPSLVSSAYGGWTFTAATGVLTMNASANPGAGISVRGLPLGFYKIRFNNNNASQFIVTEAFDAITPIHANGRSFYTGSLALNTNTKFNSQTALSGIDLSKAKAWLAINTSTDQILGSYNIAGFIQIAGGQHLFYFERPMKDDKYVVLTSSFVAEENPNTLRPSYFRIDSTSDTSYLAFAVFGELEDEDSQ